MAGTPERRFTDKDWGTIVSVLRRELGPAQALAAASAAGEGTTGVRVRLLTRYASEERDLFLLKALDKALAEVAQR